MMSQLILLHTQAVQHGIEMVYEGVYFMILGGQCQMLVLALGKCIKL